MTFPYVIEWTPQLRAEADAARVRDTFGGAVWPEPALEEWVPRPVVYLVPNPDPSHPLVPCARCGVPRTVKSSSSPICGDCRWVLTPEERKAWAA